MIYFKDFDYNSFKEFARDPKNITEKVIKLKDEKGKVISEEKELWSNIIFTFDCETTSYFIRNGEIEMFDFNKENTYYTGSKVLKQSLWYIWQVGINGIVLYGRTYKEYKEFELKMFLIFKEIKRITYIHNLSFDLQFIFNAVGTNFDIFARKARKPITAYNETYNNMYRCSYFLTNKSLAALTKEYNLDIKKQEGLLDYNVMRTPLTPLTEEELKYCEYDILVMFEVLRKYRQNFNSVLNIPLTQTGKVRRQITRLFFRDKKHHDLIDAISPDTVKEYKQLLDVYLGGYTHANRKYSNKILHNVFSYDITSSYPYVICVEKFPMTKFTKSLKQLKDIDTNEFCYIIDVSFKNIESKTTNSFLSVSKSKITIENGKKIVGTGIISDNGRLVKAETIRYELTDCDFEVLLNNYKYEKIYINNIYTAKKEYLPLKLVNYVLELFRLKTQYKDLEGFEEKYREAKEYINAVYGMFVTKILVDTIEFNNGEWFITDMTETEAQQKLTDQKTGGQNLNFAWGVWVSAYARKNLWTLINKVGEDMVYSDTDSNKFLNSENCKYFELYNKYVENKIKQVCKDRLDFSNKIILTPDMFVAISPTGKVSELGKWDFEGCYDKFKTLGAKKYCVEKDGKLEITLSGVNKKKGSKSLNSIEVFKIGHEFGYEDCGSMTSYYNEKQIPVIFPDGHKENGKYGICIMPTTYKLGISVDYRDILEQTDAHFLGGM